jgi:hypothetical protein
MARTRINPFARRGSIRRALAVALVGAVVAAGCSGSDDEGSSSTDGGPSTTTEATTTTSTETTTTTTIEPTTTTAATTTTVATTTTTTVAEPPRSIEDVRLNELQVIGSHNSYHLAAEGALRDGLFAIVPDLAADLDYTHRPLTEQLDQFGIRQFEIDVHADPEGGHYSNREGLGVVGLPVESGIAELDQPGFKVLHIQDFDFRTTCLTLIACLAEIEAWSAAHPAHVPLHIMIEIKTETVEEIAEDAEFELPDLGVEWTVPIPTTAALLTDLENEVLAVFDRDRIIAPDDVRGGRDTLSEAVTLDGWPTLGDARGKVMLSLLDRGPSADLYRSGAPALEGRLFFTHADPGAPDAAIVRFDDPIADATGIEQALADGYLVRTRSDDDGTPDSDTSQRDAALASGAQYVSTDVYEDVGRGFVVRLPADAVVRCSPVTASELCVDSELAE